MLQTRSHDHYRILTHAPVLLCDWPDGNHPGIGGTVTFDGGGPRIYSIRATVEYCADCPVPAVPVMETDAAQDLITAAIDPWSATVGDCRYSGAIGGGTHCDGSCSLLETLNNQADVQDCKDSCDANDDCHAFDTDFPFRHTCWLFSNVEGEHIGDGTATSRCYVKSGSHELSLVGHDITPRNHPDGAANIQFIDTTLVFSDTGRVVAWDVFTGRPGTQNLQVWRPTDDANTFQLICENEITSPGAYVLAGVDCNCGDRVEQVGQAAPTRDQCAQRCDDNPDCVSFGTWENSQRATGYCALFDAECPQGAHGGVIDGEINCPNCADDPNCEGQYPRPTGISSGYTNEVYNKANTRGSDFHYELDPSDHCNVQAGDLIGWQHLHQGVTDYSDGDADADACAASPYCPNVNRAVRWHFGNHPGVGGSITFNAGGDAGNRVYSVQATVVYGMTSMPTEWPAGALFYEDFENGLSRWRGQSGDNPETATIVMDTSAPMVGDIADGAVCGGTAWRSWDECRAGTVSGGIHISNGGLNGRRISTLDECVAACAAQCPETCNYVSFSLENGDCSWYDECDLANPPLTILHYQSVAVGTNALGGHNNVLRLNGCSSGGDAFTVATMDCTPENPCLVEYDTKGRAWQGFSDGFPGASLHSPHLQF